ncbi:cytochrome b [Pseudomonas sp. R5(2019)]|uniref:cytochrome b n=1 Tax=Pseudomonas sp. R5(2019) TaxID=2697566 RepID=UPI00141223D9|nr:cytochrome b [Pseudomonas sp. R5(2019)]NBA94289.1 cytochrome B [Pseudomonas sp. R5(2019)]
MSLTNTPTRYGSLSIALHWLMLVLLAAVYACIELRGLFPKDSVGRAQIKDLHFMLGLSVFLLVWLRLLLTVISPTPRIVPSPPRWQLGLATLMHWALYLFMIGMPIAGWLILSAADKPIPFFGLELPALIGPDKAQAKFIEGWHERIGTLGYWLIGLHALAGLYHHYVVRDNTLVRMLPGGD